LGLRALSPSDGSLLWEYPFKDFLMESSATPVRMNDLLIVSSITQGTVALRRDAKDGKPAAESVWKKPTLPSYFATPVPVGQDYLYLVTGTNPLNLLNPLGKKKKIQADLHCIEAKSGNVLWTRPKVGTYHATLLRTGDDKLLMLEEAGDLVLIDPNPKEYRELSRARVCGQTWAHPALADGRFFIRDGKELICVQLNR
jgi:hypothetical protein